MTALPVSHATPGTPGTPGTPDTTFHVSGEPNGRGVHVNPNLAGLPEDPKTREQILRERYMKGLKKRTCTVCGNTARARCPFRACKTCCSRARNVCSVHDNKSASRSKPEGPIVHPSFNAPPSGPVEQQSWLGATLQASMGSSYLRPGYSVPSPYNVPTPMGLGIGHPTPVDTSAAAKNYGNSTGARAWGGNPILDQQEIQRLRSLRIAAQKEAYMTNIWRLQRIKEHAASEILAEDEAFDRYMSNSSLLEEIFSLRAGPLRGFRAIDQLLHADGKTIVEDDETRIEESSLLDAMRSRFGANSKRKGASRQKLKQVIEKALLRLRKPGHESSEVIVEDEESTLTAPVRIVRWESKRFKAQTEEGKQCLKRTEAFDMLQQKLINIKNLDFVQECIDLYKTHIGHDLSHLLPHLIPTEDASTSIDSLTGNEKVDRPLTSPTSSSAASQNFVTGAYPGSNPADQDQSGPMTNGNVVPASARVVGSGGSVLPVQEARHVNKMKERPWEYGVENLERLHWHRKFVRGLGYWKVYASDDAIHSMCVEAEKSGVALQQL